MSDQTPETVITARGAVTWKLSPSDNELLASIDAKLGRLIQLLGPAVRALPSVDAIGNFAPARSVALPTEYPKLPEGTLESWRQQMKTGRGASS